MLMIFKWTRAQPKENGAGTEPELGAETSQLPALHPQRAAPSIRRRRLPVGAPTRPRATRWAARGGKAEGRWRF